VFPVQRKQARRRKRLQRLTRMARRLPRAAIAALGAAMLAALSTASFLPAVSAWQRAVWLEIRVPDVASADVLNEAVVELAPNGQRLRGFVVDPPAQTSVVAVEPQRGLHARLSLAVDGAAVPDAAIRGDARWRLGGEWIVGAPGLISLLEAGSPPRELWLKFERVSGEGRVRVRWAGLEREIALDDTGPDGEMRFARGSQRSGWIMVPPVPLDGATIRLPMPAANCNGIEAVAHLPPLVSDVAARDGRDCVMTLATGPLNRTPLGWLLLACLAAAALAGTAGWGVARFACRHPIMLVQSARMARGRIPIWPLAMTAGPGMIVHGAIAIAYVHGVSPDSLDYLRNGWALGLGIDARLEVFRTPLYPLFIAANTALFGLSTTAVVVGQHAFVLVAALLTCLLVVRRYGALAGALAGVAAAVAPFVALMANLVWTEALFAAAATLAGIVLATARPGWRSGLAIGGLLGLGGLIRPAGVILAVAGLGWVALAWLFRPASQSGLRHGAFAGALALSVAALTVPWVAYVHAQAGRWSTGVMESLMAPDPIPPDVLWQRTSSATYATWLLTFYNHVVPRGLAANLPLGDAPLLFDWRYSSLGFPTLFPTRWLWDERYPAEMLRESWRAAPAAWLRTTADLSWYGVTLRHLPEVRAFAQMDLLTLTHSPHVYRQIRDQHLNRFEPSTQARVIDDLRHRFDGSRGPEVDRLAALAASLQYGGVDSSTPAYGILRWAGIRYYRAWPVLSVIALAIAAMCLFRTRWRPMAALALTWLVFVIVHAATGIAGERYAAVLEPQILVLLMMAVPLMRDLSSDLIGQSPRSRSAAAP
jgi:hypothetical protein